MPLNKFTSALLRIASLFPHEFSSMTAYASGAHPLHELLKPHLLTTRSAADKWNSTVPKLLENEQSNGSPEEEIMWFNLKHEKTEEPPENQDPDEAEEQCRVNWLRRMEQREVMIQIIQYFLLLSLPGPPKPKPKRRKTPSITAPSPSPRKPKHTDDEQSPLEERLEAFMDRVSMWQLMGTIDSAVGGDESIRRPGSSTQNKGKEKAADERDWMQKFCEDVIQPLFEDSLPDLCALLHSKVFSSSPFSDGSDSFTPPASPEANTKRLTSISTFTATSASQSARQTSQRQGLSRTNSLSASLQEERFRERSKSLSVGPGKARGRVLTREVSMSTAFKGKSKPATVSKATVTKEKEKDRRAVNSKTVRDQGVTLVEATPAKPKDTAARSQRLFQSQSKSKVGTPLPSMLESSQRVSVEGDEDDDDWTVQSPPDILLIQSDGEEEVNWHATPTKRRRARR